MDIPRKINPRKKWLRRIIITVLVLSAVAALTVALSRLKPAAPTVGRASAWLDTVKRGPMVLEVRGIGTLVPEELSWIPAMTAGTVVKVLMRPGARASRDRGEDSRIKLQFQFLEPGRTPLNLDSDKVLTSVPGLAISRSSGQRGRTVGCDQHVRQAHQRDFGTHLCYEQQRLGYEKSRSSIRTIIQDLSDNATHKCSMLIPTRMGAFPRLQDHRRG